MRGGGGGERGLRAAARQQEHAGAALRQERRRIERERRHGVAEALQQRHDSGEIAPVVGGQESGHVLHDHRLRVFGLHLREDAHELGNEAGLRAVQSGAVPGERHIDARERCRGHLHRRDVVTGQVADVADNELGAPPVRGVERGLGPVDVVGERRRHADALQTGPHEAHPGEELRRSHLRQSASRTGGACRPFTPRCGASSRWCRAVGRCGDLRTPRRTGRGAWRSCGGACRGNRA